MTAKRENRRLQLLEILDAAAPGRSLYGYEIWDWLEPRPTRPTVYRALRSLERNGYVESRWEVGHLRTAPPRRLYRITDAGREMVAADHLGRVP